MCRASIPTRVTGNSRARPLNRAAKRRTPRDKESRGKPEPGKGEAEPSPHGNPGSGEQCRRVRPEPLTEPKRNSQAQQALTYAQSKGEKSETPHPQLWKTKGKRERPRGDPGNGTRTVPKGAKASHQPGEVPGKKLGSRGQNDLDVWLEQVQREMISP